VECVGAFDLRDIITNIRYRQENYQKGQSAEDVVTLAQRVTRATTALGGPQDIVGPDRGAEADSAMRQKTTLCPIVTGDTLHGEHLLGFELSTEACQGAEGY
jgi:hypothetical protein